MDLTMKEVIQITGMPNRRIKQLAESGVLSLELKTGKGVFRKYSTLNLIELSIAERLADMGVELNYICKLVPSISKQVSIRIGTKTKNIDTLSPGDIPPGLFVVIQKDIIEITDMDTMKTCKNVVSSALELFDGEKLFEFLAGMGGVGAIIIRLDGIINDMVRAVSR